MTGLASCNIKGQTIHSWLNLGCIRPYLKQDDKGLKANIDRIIYNPHAKWEHVKEAEVLIIDEISMCDALTFDIINEVLQWARENYEPFGGLQMILVGDNYQLPPVKAGKLGYYFQSSAYKRGNFKPIVLREQHRQKAGRFLDVLNRMRVGNSTQEDIDYLNFRGLDYAKDVDLPDDTVILYPTNDEVEKANEVYFDSIDAPIQTFYSEDKRLIPKIKVNGKEIDDKLDKDLRVPYELKLKKGCSVLLLANLDVAKGVVNGSKGIYQGMISKDKLLCKFNGVEIEVPKRDFEVWKYDKVAMTRTQFPLMLGHSVTIHKAQGMTLDKAFVDLSKIFAPHQVYVALSRVKTLEGLYVRGLTLDKIQVDRNIVSYMNELERVAV